jgi:ribosome biogenesis protein BMS1
MKMLKVNHKFKEEKRKMQLTKKHVSKLKMREKEEIRKLQKQKDLKKKVFRALSKISKDEEKGKTGKPGAHKGKAR